MRAGMPKGYRLPGIEDKSMKKYKSDIHFLAIWNKAVINGDVVIRGDDYIHISDNSIEKIARKWLVIDTATKEVIDVYNRY